MWLPSQTDRIVMQPVLLYVWSSPGSKRVYFLKVRSFVSRNFLPDQLGEWIEALPSPPCLPPSLAITPLFSFWHLSCFYSPFFKLVLFLPYVTLFLSLFSLFFFIKQSYPSPPSPHSLCLIPSHSFGYACEISRVTVGRAGDLWLAVSRPLSGAGKALLAAACIWMTMENQSHYASQPCPLHSGHRRLHLVPWFMDAILAPERNM